MIVYESLCLQLYELMRMGGPPVLQPLHSGEVDDEHDEIVDADVMAIRIEPKWEDALIHHNSFNDHRPDLCH